MPEEPSSKIEIGFIGDITGSQLNIAGRDIIIHSQSSRPPRGGVG